MKIIEEPIESDISVYDMSDGQIAIVTNWANSSPIGKIVQRHKDDLIVLGGVRGDCYSGLCGYGEENQNPLNRVRILPPGTKLEI